MKESDMFESDVVTFVAPSKAGWLEKRRQGPLPTWKRRWFVLADSCLYYFLKPTDDDTLPRCIIPLDNCRVGRGLGALEIHIAAATGGKLKSCKNVGYGVTMKMGSRTELILKAESAEEREEWVRLLQANADRTPVQKKMMAKINDLRMEKEGGGSGGGLRGGGLLDGNLFGSSSSFSSSSFSSSSHVPLELPPLKAEGWMKKRGEINTGWLRRYFCVFSDSASTTLYYYVSKEMAQRMVDLGEGTHKGCLDLREVVKMNMTKDGDDAVIDLVTGGRTWHFSTGEKEELAYWMDVFTASCQLSVPRDFKEDLKGRGEPGAAKKAAAASGGGGEGGGSEGAGGGFK